VARPDGRRARASGSGRFARGRLKSIGLALAFALAGAPEPAARPLVIFVEHFGSDLYAERAGLALASACKVTRPVSILARSRGRVDHLTDDGAVVSTVRRADLYSALAAAFREAGKGADVVYIGRELPLGGGTAVVGSLQVPRTSLAFDRALAALRKSGATFHGVSFTALPDDGMRRLAEKSGGDVWTAHGASVPSAALDRLCR
jgi:hypothetical protein